MPRLYRPSELYEVCQRTNRGELLIDLNNVERMREIIGVFGEAQRRYQVPIFAFHLMSNHYHGLFGAPTPQKLERFLGFVHAGIARLINRDQKEPGVVWGGKPHVLPVALDEKTLLRRVAYIMGQGVRAELVRHPAQFPGPSSVDWLIGGKPILGVYVDSTGKYRAESLKNPPKAPTASDQEREVVISKLPCFETQTWAELHPRFMQIADDLAGLSLAELHALAMPAKVASVDLKRAGHKDQEKQQKQQDPPLRQADDLQSETGELAAVELPEKLELPDPLDPETGLPQRRGPPPPKPGQKGRRKMPLILASSDAVRAKYEEELAEFLKDHGRSRLRLGRQLRLGGSVRQVKLPKYALLGGGLAGPCGP
jgi:REP element-mobilizing transposase RayT